MARDVVRFELRDTSFVGGAAPPEPPAFRTRDPSFEKLEQRMDELVSRLLRRPSQATYQRAWAPRVDVYETADEYVAIAELAAVYSGDVTIEISGEEVAIIGERPHIEHPAGADCLQLEIPFGGFERRLVLPSPVDPVTASASFSDGLLTVRLPKIKSGPMKVQVEITTLATPERSEGAE